MIIQQKGLASVVVAVVWHPEKQELLWHVVVGHHRCYIASHATYTGWFAVLLSPCIGRSMQVTSDHSDADHVSDTAVSDQLS